MRDIRKIITENHKIEIKQRKLTKPKTGSLKISTN